MPGALWPARPRSSHSTDAASLATRTAKRAPGRTCTTFRPSARYLRTTPTARVGGEMFPARSSARSERRYTPGGYFSPCFPPYQLMRPADWVSRPRPTCAPSTYRSGRAVPETVYETVTYSPRLSRSGEKTRGATLLMAISAGFVLTEIVFGSV